MNIYTSYAPSKEGKPELKRISDIIEDIRSDEHAMLIYSLRNENDKEMQEILKVSLPVFVPCVQVFNTKGLANDSIPTGLVQFDIDTKDNVGIDIDEIIKKLITIPELIYCFKSPRNGIKFSIMTDFMKLESDTVVSLKKRFRIAYGRCKSYLRNYIDVKLDDSMASISQLCFLSFDSDTYFNPKCDSYKINDDCVIVDSSHTDNTAYPDTQIGELLKFIPRDLGWEMRRLVNFSVSTAIGDEGINLLLNHWSTENREKLEKDLNSQFELEEEKGISFLINLAKDNGWKPPAMRSLVSQTAQKSEHEFERLYTVEEGEELMLNITNDFFNKKKSAFINISTSFGKTYSVMKIINQLPWTVRVLILVPTHKLGKELIDEYLNGKGTNSRKSVLIKGKNKYCQDKSIREKYDESGLPIPIDQCKYGCALFPCQYMYQFDGLDNTRIMTHKEFSNHSSAWFNGIGHNENGNSIPSEREWIPEFIIVDENWFEKEEFMESIDNEHDGLKEVIYQCSKGSSLKDAVDKNRDYLLSDYCQMKSASVKKPEFNTIDQYILDAKQVNKGIQRESVVLEKIRHYLVTDDDSFLIPIRLVKNSLRYSRMKDIDDQYKGIPTLFLDATAEESVVKSVIGNIDYHSIKIKQKEGVNVYQAENFNLSKDWLNKRKNRDLLVKKLIELNQKYGKVGLISYKNISGINGNFIQWLSDKTGITNIGWFGNLRGLNSFEDVDCLVIVGRNRLPESEFYNYAYAVFNGFDTNDVEYLDAPIRMKDGTSMVLKERRFVDTKLELVRQHFSTAETIQAIGRGRLIRKKDKDVYVLSNESLGADVEISGFIRKDDFFEIVKYQAEINNLLEIGYCRNKPKYLKELGFTDYQIKNDKERILSEFFHAEIIEETIEFVDQYRNKRKWSYFVAPDFNLCQQLLDEGQKAA